MQKVTLTIENLYDSQVVRLEDELSVGRTDAADVVLQDGGLSRKNTTFFRDGDEVLIVDENSTNGTYLNGERLSGAPRVLKDGDRVKIGSETRITVEIGETFTRERELHREITKTDAPKSGVYDIRLGRYRNEDQTFAAPPTQNAKTPTKKPPFVLLAAIFSSVAIVVLGSLAYFVATRYESSVAQNTGKPLQQISTQALIPVRVIDPLGGEDENDLDDLIASWEVQEEEINAANVADINVSTADTEEKELNVSAAFLAEQQRKAFAPRSGETGIRPAGMIVPKELFGDGVVKQKAKLREMNATGYRQPMDFADLAEKRLNRELFEMPMATESFYLDVGGSAKDSPFTSFSFQGGTGEIAPGTPKYQTLARLASNFAGTQYDLNNPAHRKQMRIRLLRMFNKRAKPVLKELADAYHQRFGRPLRVTSLTRSMDYQIGLNATNPNSFKVRGEGSLPPHTSGCAFDLARKHMTAEEQNFVMNKLAEMENRGVLDALIEYGANACFHVFVYDDGIPPKM